MTLTSLFRENIRLQSRYLYMQAAGSDGQDGTARGLHLRWAFRDSLGEEHLPKGDLAATGPYATNIRHNRPDDFVYLYRMNYDRSKAPQVDLRTAPGNITVSFLKREWEYLVPGFSGSVKVFIRFLDPDLYDTITIDPTIEPLLFLERYTGIIQLSVEGSLLFGAAFDFKPIATGGSDQGALMLEVLSAEHGDAGAALSLACRKTLLCAATAGCTERIVCENIRFLHLKQDKAVLTKITLEPYFDFFRSQANPDLVGKFSVTTDELAVEKRLEDPANFMIDNRWPQYNDGTTVKVANYKDKWWGGPDGIKVALDKFLTLSTTDILAVEVLPSDDPHDEARVPISYLSILNLLAADFHLARMLGLGHIDVPQAAPADGFIYLAFYDALPKFVYTEQTITTERIGLAYLSLPTTLSDFRLPPKPALRDLSYGLNIEGQAADLLFNGDGYSNFYDVRFVNIRRKEYDHEMPLQPFFATHDEYCTSQQTQAILYGIEYSGEGETRFRKPEITSLVNKDAGLNYFAWDSDQHEVPETIPIPDNNNGLFVHHETEEGIHNYAIYGINWFSRSSPVSELQRTDFTRFPQKNKLQAPSNVAVQYIQQEETLVFTTQAEQNELAARAAANPGGDNNFTRITFEYNHHHHTAYPSGNKINFYFREQLPLEVKGKILQESDHNGNDLLSRLTVGAYTSLETGDLISPVIPSGWELRFAGAVLSTETGQFTVKEIIPGVPFPVIIVQRIIKRTVIADTHIDAETGEPVTSYHNAGGSPERPKVHEKFLLVENLSAEAQWTKLARQVDIIHFSGHTEQEMQEGGGVVTLQIGGIFGKAAIVPSTSIPGIDGLEGVSKVTFQSERLINHSDSGVSWYKGIARIRTASGSMRMLEVMRIESQNPLIIWIYDPEYATDPIPSGNNLDVNFHPGYKLYLYPEPAANFDRLHIHPLTGHTKLTLIGTQSVDSINIPEHRSPVSIPAALMAQRIIDPVPPAIPIGPAFATRPDFYGKSTYTFNVEVNTSGGRTPFGLVFFRANDTAILQALYEKDTLTQIGTDLQKIPTQQFTVNRFNDLVNVVFDTDPAHAQEFKEYEGYRLPLPDKEGLLTGSETVIEKREKLRKAIDKVFVPLTATPPLFEFLKTGRTTEGIPPSIKNSHGDLLDLQDPAFHPFPMARRFTENGKTFVRFTDYTLDGTSVNMYFYFGIEISAQLVMSGRGPVNGPVMLVNSFAPEAPVIKAVMAQTANPVEGSDPLVFFQIAPYLENDRIEKVQVYRTTDPSQAQTVRTMTMAATCALDQIIDAFEELPYPPFGETIYYRLVALRRIINERNEEEWIPSKASDLLLTNVIDVVNPEAPELHFNHNPPGADHALHDVELVWEPTCYNGTYHLYKMGRKGGWEKLYSVKGNETMRFPPAGDFDTYPQMKILEKENDEGRLVYHRFKVEVVNAAGLLNLVPREAGV